MELLCVVVRFLKKVCKGVSMLPEIAFGFGVACAVSLVLWATASMSKLMEDLDRVQVSAHLPNRSVSEGE
jgi:hypothetical protein